MSDGALSVSQIPVPDAEHGLIGIALTETAATEDVTLSADDFADPDLGRVWATIAAMQAEGLPVDVITVADRLPQNIGLRLFGLDTTLANPGNVSVYAGIIQRRALRARYVAVAQGILKMSDTLEVDQLTQYIDGHLANIQSAQPSTKLATFAALYAETVDEMERQDTFSPTPWHALNKVIGGWRPGAMYVIAARPSEGKSLVALQAALSIAKDSWVAFSSLEMRGPELVKRAISAQLTIPVGAVNDSRMTPEQWYTLEQNRHLIEQVRIAIDSNPHATPGTVRRHARQVQKEAEQRGEKLGAVVVDYLQLMNSPDGEDSRQAAVAGFSRALKTLANDLQVPVFALSQLNRALESRADSKPRVSDLRESGAIEQDADCILLLSRDREHGELGITVGKNRSGPAGMTIPLVWEGGYSRVSDFGPDEELPSDHY